jgi:hypothetical protein
MALQTFLFMTSSQANLVRGLTVNSHALAPVMTIIPGITTFVLPLSVLTDNFHELRNSILATLSQQTLQTSAILPVTAYPSSIQTIVQNCTYKSSWPVGITITVSTV